MTEEKGLHVGIIMDGNRRWAKARGLPSFKGHSEGAEAFKRLLNSMKDAGVSELTLYTLSMQNLKRSEDEKKHLFSLFTTYFSKFKDDPSLVENQIKVDFIGRTELLPGSLQVIMRELKDKTKDHSRYRLNFAIAYGGREELLDAINKLVDKGKAGKKIDEEDIRANLYLGSDPDFIIRTGGERRTSNFLIWQSSYSEWFFIDKYWPDFTKQDLMDCIAEFNKRERRFGR